MGQSLLGFQLREEVSEDGEVVHGRGEGDEQVPYSVRERYTPVGLKEEHAGQIQHAAQFQILHRRELVLEDETHVHFTDISKL